MSTYLGMYVFQRIQRYAGKTTEVQHFQKSRFFKLIKTTKPSAKKSFSLKVMLREKQDRFKKYTLQSAGAGFLVCVHYAR